MKNLYRIIVLLIACNFLLTGCWDQKIFEQIGLVLTVGIEKSDDGKLLVTYIYPVMGGKEKDGVDMISTESSLLRGARENVNHESPKLLESGKTQQVLISEDLARTGIHNILEVFQRDVALPTIASVVIVEGSPHELLEKGKEFQYKPRLSFYLLQLLENNSKLSNIPDTRIYNFDIDYYAPGIDPIVPMIRLREKSVVLIGCALFTDDKMVGNLDSNNTIMLMGLMGKLKDTYLVFESKQYPTSNPNNYGISLIVSTQKRKIDIAFDEEGIPIININLKFNCILQEYRWDETDKMSEKNKLEKSLSKQLTTSCNEVVKKMQVVNSDPIGLGNLIRAKYYQYWQNIDWKEVYPEAKINVDASIKILKSGIIK